MGAKAPCKITGIPRYGLECEEEEFLNVLVNGSGSVKRQGGHAPEAISEGEAPKERAPPSEFRQLITPKPKRRNPAWAWTE
eukprot:6468979-Prorocentrum_lima.AAC.1